MQLTLSLDAIYLGSLCKVSSAAARAFRLKTNLAVIAAQKGMIDDDGVVESAEDKGKHAAELLLNGGFTEQPSGIAGTGSASRMGMSYFPFVSSRFALEFDLNVTLRSLIIEVPSPYRIIWNTINVQGPDGASAKVTTSYGEKMSVYVFQWSGSTAPGRVTISFIIRTGGPQLLRTAFFPLYYYVIALMAVGTAAHAENPNVLLTAIAAAWVFLLRHLNSCELPRRSVLIFYIVIMLGIFLMIWGLSHRFFSGEMGRLGILFEGIGIGALLLGLLAAFRRFEKDGTLPLWLVKAWAARIQDQDPAQ